MDGWIMDGLDEDGVNNGLVTSESLSLSNCIKLYRS